MELRVEDIPAGYLANLIVGDELRVSYVPEKKRCPMVIQLGEDRVVWYGLSVRLRANASLSCDHGHSQDRAHGVPYWADPPFGRSDHPQEVLSCVRPGDR